MYISEIGEDNYYNYNVRREGLEFEIIRYITYLN